MTSPRGTTIRSVDLVVRGGRVVTATDVVDTAIAVAGGTIVALGPESALPPADRVIDATGKIVFPGLIDCHLHVGPEYDDWTTAPLAAARTGLTTLLPFVTYDEGETLPRAIHRLREEAESLSVLDFGFHVILNHEPYILDGLADAVKQGVTSFKLFMTYKKRPKRMVSDEFIAKTMDRLAPLGGLCQLHCENGDVLCFLEDQAIAAGRTAPTDFPATCPDWTEEEAINRAILIGRLTGCPVYVVHLSTRLGLERIMRAQAEGQRVWTETCPQYLLLSEDEMEKHGPFAKIGPPLRPAHGGDHAALWRGSANGFISTVASDHSPRVPAAKEPGRKNIFVDDQGRPIPFGSPSLETLVPLMYTEGVVKRGLPLTWMARVLAENPARIFGLYPRKGLIRPGADADFTIWDPAPEWTIARARHLGIAGFTPYEGWKMRGRAWTTLLRGQVMLNPAGELEQKPGFGVFLPRTTPMAPIAGAAR
ncbi:MAG: amidohydrolase family protein [Candidatus Rokubacteria bacterium]|nr:amidohydrolase family protein [Candidatus Rokubacteria bacterium]